MKTKLKERLLNWIVCWAYLFDGVVGVLSLGFILPNLSFRASCLYLNNSLLFIPKH
jgi:hypothetical protein